VVFDEEPTAARQRPGEVGTKVRPELGAPGSDAARQVLPHARARGFERHRVHTLVSHFLKCFFESVFRHRLLSIRGLSLPGSLNIRLARSVTTTAGARCA
jgi:hypothetical protein